MTEITTQPADWVPDACTLPTAERPLRAAEFDDLFATSLRDLQSPTSGARRVRLVLAGDADLPARVQQLADAETLCCSFFTFTLNRLDDVASRAGDEAVVTLDIEVPAAHTVVLDALVRRADAARQATT